MADKIIVTGGAGYIGSHTVLALLESGYEVFVIDSLERGYKEALNRVEKLTNKKINFYQADLRKKEEVELVLNKIDEVAAVIHFAAYKDVGEADKFPDKYYLNNIGGTLNLLQAINNKGIKRFVFSSTSAVYGDSEIIPMHEQLPIKPKNAYGRSKATVEWILEDFYSAYGMNSVVLRYFNAAGAHPSGKIGEDPARCGNVVPLIMQTLVGKREKFLLYGDQFATSDGSQERDYIHVMDLATGHLAAIRKLAENGGFHKFNLGTGKATSNRTLIKLSEEISQRKLNFEVVAPRLGDPKITVSDATQASQELNWKAQYEIADIIRDQWNWVVNNPEGYSTNK